MHPAAKIPHIPYCSYRAKKKEGKKPLTKVINLKLMWILRWLNEFRVRFVYCEQIKKKITAVLAIKYFCDPPFDCLHCSCTEVFTVLWMLQLPVNFLLNSYLIVFSPVPLMTPRSCEHHRERSLLHSPLQPQRCSSVLLTKKNVGISNPICCWIQRN